MAHGDAQEGKRRGNWHMEWVASTLHTTSEHGVSSITTTDTHTSAAISWKNLCPRQFKWTRPFRQKKKSGFCACAITFQKQSTCCSCQILMEFEFSQQILKKYSNIKFHKNPSSGSQVVTCGQIDRHDKANSHFLQFCKHA
jgi:hypothetical protein